MILSEVKEALTQAEEIAFQLPSGELVPAHFHVTEIGQVTKQFIDCGGTVRRESHVNFQLWNAADYNHRLHPEKLLEIIALSEKYLAVENGEVEVEYQGETIETYGLKFDGKRFLLTPKNTDCLAKDKCGIPEEKPKVAVGDSKNNSCCTPDSGCC